MTQAPENLKAVRGLLLTHLNVDPDAVRSADLEPAEVGIVGDSNHRGGYHCGEDRVVPNDYSVVESSRDANGLTLDAAALDVGLFEVHSGGGIHTLRTFSVWCVQQCAANAPDTRDIREIIYSPDGEVVRRFDRLGRRSSGDDSHLWHTHFSFFRDAIKAGRDLTPLFRRYLTSIGLLEDDMTPTEVRRAAFLGVYDALYQMASQSTREGRFMVTQYEKLQTITAQPDSDDVDEIQIIQGVLAGLTPEKIAAAIPPTVADQVAENLARRLAS